MAFRIVRFYFNADIRRRVIKRVPTEALAQEYCHDPETSSSTCTKPENKRRTRLYGPWFDGYEEAN